MQIFKSKPDIELTFWEHLEELRWTLLKIIGIVAMSAIFSLYFAESLIQLLLKPSKEILKSAGVILILSGPFDAFWIKLKVGLIAGVIFSSPGIFYFLWSFITPALYDNERKHIRSYFFAGACLFLTGAVIAYFSIPFLLNFAIQFMIEGVENIWRLNDFISFCLLWMLICGAISETPIIVLSLVRLGIVNVETLQRSRPYAIVIIFLIAALLTPPEPISQILLAIPLVILFELSIFIAKFAKN